MIGSNNIPLGIEVAVKNGVQAAQEMERIAKSTKSVETAFAGLGGKIAGAFSVAAITSFARSAVSYTSQFKDISDQFSISASQAEGFSRQIREVGGSTEKAIGILGKLQAFQEETNDPRGLGEFINSLRESYQATGDFGKIIEVVGVKNAPVFAAALREMKGGLEQFTDATFDSTSALGDFYSEKLDLLGDKVKAVGSKLAVGLGVFMEAVGAGFGTLSAGEGFAQGWEGAFSAAAKQAQNMADSTKQARDAMAEMREKRAGDKIAQDFFKAEIQRLDVINKQATPAEMIDWLEKQKIKLPEEKVAKVRELGPLNFSASMAAGSSEAIVNYQKYRQGGSATVESEQLRTQRLIERYARETAENTRDNVQFDVIGGEITDL